MGRGLSRLEASIARVGVVISVQAVRPVGEQVAEKPKKPVFFVSLKNPDTDIYS
jgi:hypothetical protein